MNIAQENVLKKIISHYKETGSNSFDSASFSVTENIALKELESNGYLTVSSDIVETVSLSDELLDRISNKEAF